MECSAKENIGVSEIFDAATTAALNYKSSKRKRRGSFFIRKGKQKEETLERVKLVLMGDGACGKTDMLSVFSKGSFAADYTPTVFETHTVNIDHNGKKVEIVSKCDI